MPLLRSLFNLVALGSIMVDDPVPQYLIGKILRGLALVIVTSVLFVAFLLTGFVCLYHFLLTKGLSELDASFVILGGLALVAVISLALTLRHVCGLKKSLRANIKRPVPLTTHVANEAGDVVKAFVDGFMKR